MDPRHGECLPHAKALAAGLVDPPGRWFPPGTELWIAESDAAGWATMDPQLRIATLAVPGCSEREVVLDRRDWVPVGTVVRGAAPITWLRLRRAR
ncbi:MAG TPA: hypothetical protein VEI97_10120 [bacterium]|nr:hypothetical protein [bacterium]